MKIPVEHHHIYTSGAMIGTVAHTEGLSPQLDKKLKTHDELDSLPGYRFFPLEEGKIKSAEYVISKTVKLAPTDGSSRLGPSYLTGRRAIPLRHSVVVNAYHLEKLSWDVGRLIKQIPFQEKYEGDSHFQKEIDVSDSEQLEAFEKLAEELGPAKTGHLCDILFKYFDVESINDIKHIFIISDNQEDAYFQRVWGILQMLPACFRQITSFSTQEKKEITPYRLVMLNPATTSIMQRTDIIDLNTLPEDASSKLHPYAEFIREALNNNNDFSSLRELLKFINEYIASSTLEEIDRLRKTEPLEKRTKETETEKCTLVSYLAVYTRLWRVIRYEDEHSVSNFGKVVEDFSKHYFKGYPLNTNTRKLLIDEGLKLQENVKNFEEELLGLYRTLNWLLKSLDVAPERYIEFSNDLFKKAIQHYPQEASKIADALNLLPLDITQQVLQDMQQNRTGPWLFPDAFADAKSPRQVALLAEAMEVLIRTAVKAVSRYDKTLYTDLSEAFWIIIESSINNLPDERKKDSNVDKTIRNSIANSCVSVVDAFDQNWYSQRQQSLYQKMLDAHFSQKRFDFFVDLLIEDPLNNGWFDDLKGEGQRLTKLPKEYFRAAVRGIWYRYIEQYSQHNVTPARLFLLLYRDSDSEQKKILIEEAIFTVPDDRLRLHKQLTLVQAMMSSKEYVYPIRELDIQEELLKITDKPTPASTSPKGKSSFPELALSLPKFEKYHDRLDRDIIAIFYNGLVKFLQVKQLSNSPAKLPILWSYLQIDKYHEEANHLYEDIIKFVVNQKQWSASMLAEVVKASGRSSVTINLFDIWCEMAVAAGERPERIYLLFDKGFDKEFGRNLRQLNKEELHSFGEWLQKRCGVMSDSIKNIWKNRLRHLKIDSSVLWNKIPSHRLS